MGKKQVKDEQDYMIHGVEFTPLARFMLAGGYSALLNTSDKCKGKLDDADSEMAGEIFDKLKFTDDERRDYIVEVPGVGEQPIMTRLEKGDAKNVSLSKYEIRFLRDVITKGPSWRPIDRAWLKPLLASFDTALNTHTS